MNFFGKWNEEKLLLCTLFFFLSVSCKTKEARQINYALQMAGGNRTELEKALHHYDAKEDFEKASAVRFLVSNMSGCWGVDDKFGQRYQPLYEEYRSLIKSNDGVVSFYRAAADSLWRENRFRYPRPEDMAVMDLKRVDSAYLIRQTELAFEAWKGNAYTRDCPFETFLDYILPFRMRNGLVLDSVRESFRHRYAGSYFTSKTGNFMAEVDSLLYRYRNIKHNGFVASGIPIMSASTLEYLERGLCEHRCWFNTLLLSSLGMATTTDFVPAWGNRNNSHTWNAVIVNGKSYAFEPFGDVDRWKYKRIYNNLVYDSIWGKFRLPKVYRKTYSLHPSLPYMDRRVAKEDIPPLFLDQRKTDVSAEYFDTVNISVRLSSAPKGVYYAYLCVFGYQRWHPVQVGEIKDDKVVFEGMGKDIVYMPAFYRDGRVVPAGSPFYLNQNGKKELLEPIGVCHNMTVSGITGAALYEKAWREEVDMAGCLFLADDNPDFLRPDTLGSIPQVSGLEENVISVDTTRLYRYARLVCPRDTFSAGEVHFYESEGGVKIKPKIFRHSFRPIQGRVEYLIDGLSATGFKGVAGEGRLRAIDFDLGRMCRIVAVGWILCHPGEIEKDVAYELFYWEDGAWQSLGKRKSDEGWIRFENVPTGALYQLVNCNWSDRVERVFIYKDGEVRWM